MLIHEDQPLRPVPYSSDGCHGTDNGIHLCKVQEPALAAAPSGVAVEFSVVVHRNAMESLGGYKCVRWREYVGFLRSFRTSLTLRHKLSLKE